VGIASASVTTGSWLVVAGPSSVGIGSVNKGILLSRGVPVVYSKGLELSPVGIDIARKLARTSSVGVG